MWLCACCGGKGQPILVPYMLIGGDGVRRQSLFCSRCDMVTVWPVYTRTAPRIA